MTTHEFLQLIHFSTLLDQVIPVLGRLLEEELPQIVADERHNDHHRQMTLPLAERDDISGNFDTES
jgi:hypothetical protein